MTASITKPLKWTAQRVNHLNKTSQRVQKKKTNTSAKFKKQVANNDPKQEMKRLEKELAFTFDSIATISVHFESLHHAYTSSKPQLDKNKSPTRLCEMEKELLTAYDDLGLQVNHLERKIQKLENRLTELKQQEEAALLISSPCSTTDSSIYTQTTPNTTPILDLDWLIDDHCHLLNTNQDYFLNQYYIMNQPMIFY